MPPAKSPFIAALESYGISPACVRLLEDASEPGLLDYLDLSRASKTADAEDLLPDAVAENDGKPLLFIVNELRLATTISGHNERLNSLRKNLACRGDRSFLARLKPGELVVVPVSLKASSPAWEVYKPGTAQSLSFFSNLLQGYYPGEGQPKEVDFVFSAMFRLVWSVADRLAQLDIKRSDVLSLMGRALFFRFLKDRKVINDKDVPSISARATSIEDCFSTWQKAAATSEWLDETFNGDLLPLSGGGDSKYFASLKETAGNVVFLHLSAIVRGEEPIGDSDYQLPLGPGWGFYNFAHVPVGLLSQVYERFAWRWEEDAQETSVHYTPRNIASGLVEEAFVELPNAAKAQILDPACGAGVFLVLAFRRLYREQWAAKGKRPETSAIRDILNKQLCGFDISESALKLAALSLYLTAIELDPHPLPLKKLRFDNLQGRVLHNFRGPNDSKTGTVAGSLGPLVGPEFNGRFDLVLSNPPWTALRDDDLANAVEKTSKEIIEARSTKADADRYQNPDKAPDLPFIWKSTVWAKVGGRIAMALHARILIRQEPIPTIARETLFSLLDITGILNGSNLRKTKAWPEMDQPFVLLYAHNRVPSPGQNFTKFLTPYPDTKLNGIGEIRIDPLSAFTIEPAMAVGKSWLWKALSIGTQLDIAIIEQIQAAGGVPLGKYWTEQLRFASSQGYRIASRENSAEELNKLKDLHSPTATLFADGPVFSIDTSKLEYFSLEKLHRTRFQEGPDKLRVYRGPIVLVKAAPPTEREKGRALLSLQDVAYNESYYGYSSLPTSEGKFAVRYLHLLAHSALWLYYALMTSAEFGFERPKLQKSDCDRFPIIPIRKLGKKKRNEVNVLSRRLLREDLTVFDDIDSFFAGLYGLESLDIQVMRDTLDLRTPSDETGKRGSQNPTLDERLRFVADVDKILAPFFMATGSMPSIKLWAPDDSYLRNRSPFHIILFTKKNGTLREPGQMFKNVLLELANNTGATRIIHETENGLVVGLLNHYRYWTPSRARLLSSLMVREYIDALDS